MEEQSTERSNKKYCVNLIVILDIKYVNTPMDITTSFCTHFIYFCKENVSSEHLSELMYLVFNKSKDGSSHLTFSLLCTLNLRHSCSDYVHVTDKVKDMKIVGCLPDW